LFLTETENQGIIDLAVAASSKNYRTEPLKGSHANKELNLFLDQVLLISLAARISKRLSTTISAFSKWHYRIGHTKLSRNNAL
jgi:hypothetical protein